MRSSKSRSRSKQNRPRSLGNIVNRVFDSSGPEGKVRGTPQQIIEKYLLLARDAQLSNDRVASENFMQHAEHYIRMLAEAQREMAREQEQRNAQHAQNQGNGHNAQGNGNGNGNGQGGNGQGDGQQRDRRDRDRSEGDSAAAPTPGNDDAKSVQDGESTLVDTPENRPTQDAQPAQDGDTPEAEAAAEAAPKPRRPRGPRRPRKAEAAATDDPPASAAE